MPEKNLGAETGLPETPQEEKTATIPNPKKIIETESMTVFSNAEGKRVVLKPLEGPDKKTADWIKKHQSRESRGGRL